MSVRHGDLFKPVAGGLFDLVVANPPYVPAATAVLPRHRKARCWDAGLDGRALLDRICAGARDVLRPGGDVLLVHSAVCGPDLTVDALTRAGLTGRVLARATVPFGPVMRARAVLLESTGLIRVGQRPEQLVVIGAHHAR